MIRKVKVLGLAAVAVLAFAAVNASSAFAAGEQFHSGVAHTTLSAEGTSNQVFTTPAGTVTCKKVTGNGTTTTVTTKEITAENIKYTECTTKTIFGTINVSVEFKGCDYKFTSEAGTPVHIECPAGSGPITITGPGCTITVAGGQTVSSTTYTNGASDVTIDANVKAITSTATGAFCSATGTSNTGTYTGSVTVKGADTAGTATSVSWS